MNIINAEFIKGKLSEANHKVLSKILIIKTKLNNKPFHFRLAIILILIIVISSSLLFNKPAHAQTFYLGGSNPFTFSANDPVAVTGNFVGQSIPSDCSADASIMLNDFLANYVIDGDSIVLPTNGCFLLDDIPPTNGSSQVTGGITLNGKANITIYGNNASFERINPDQKNVPMMTLINNSNLIMSNLTINGGYDGFNYDGPAYEGSTGILMLGNRTATINGVNVNNIQGDGIDLWFNNGHQLDAERSLNANILVTNSNFNNIGYHGITFEGVNGATFENNNFTNIHVDAIDSEFDVYSTKFDSSYSNPKLYPYPAAEDNISIVNNSWNGTAFLFYASIQGQSPGVQEQNLVIAGNNIEKTTPLLYINGTPANSSSTTAPYLNDGFFFQDNYLTNGAVAKSVGGGSIGTPDVNSTAYLRKISDVNIDNNFAPVDNGQPNYYPDTAFLSVFDAYGLGNSIANINSPTNYYNATTNPYAPNNTGNVGFNLLNNDFSGAIQLYFHNPADWVRITNPNQTVNLNATPKYPKASVSTPFPVSSSGYPTYSGSTLYKQGDVVVYNSNLFDYVDITTSSGHAPGSTDSSYGNSPYWVQVNLSGSNSLTSPYQYSTSNQSYSNEPNCSPTASDPSVQFNQGDAIEVQCSYTDPTGQANQPIYFYYVYTNTSPSNSSNALTGLKTALSQYTWKNLAAPVNITNQCNNNLFFGIQDFSNTNGPPNAGNLCTNPLSQTTCSSPINQRDSSNNLILPTNYMVGNPGHCYHPAPSAPSGVTAQYNGNNSISVHWNPVSPSNTGQTISGYYILRTINQPQTVNTQPNTSIVLTSVNNKPIICSSNPCTFTDSNISAGTSYYYGVEAVDSGGINYLSNNASNAGAPCPDGLNFLSAKNTTTAGSCIPPSVSTPSFMSTPVIDTSTFPISSFTPDSPTLNVVTPTQINLTWTQNSNFNKSNIGGYNIYRATAKTSNPTSLGNIGTLIGSIDESSCNTTCMFQDPNVSYGNAYASYYYYVVAYDKNTPINLSNPSLYQETTNPNWTAIYAPPGIASQLNVSNITTNQSTQQTELQLTWQPSLTSNGNVADGYNINEGLPSKTYANPGNWNPHDNYVRGNLVVYNSNYFIDVSSSPITGNALYCSIASDINCPDNSPNWKEISSPNTPDWDYPGIYNSSSTYSRGNLVSNTVSSTTTYYICVISTCPINSLSNVSTSSTSGDWVQDQNKTGRTRSGGVNKYSSTAVYLLGQALKATAGTTGPYYYCISITNCPKGTAITNTSYFLEVTPPPNGTFASPAQFDSTGATAYIAGNLVNYLGNYYIYTNGSSFISNDPIPTLDNNQVYWTLVTNNPYGFTTQSAWTSNSPYVKGDLVNQNGTLYVYTGSSDYSPSSFTVSLEPINDRNDWLIINSPSQTWNSQTSYSTGDLISYLGYYYISLTNSNVSNQPSPGVSSSNWQIISSSTLFVSSSDASCSLLSSKLCTYVVTGLSPGNTYSFSVSVLQFQSASSPIPLISRNSSTQTGTTYSSLACQPPTQPSDFSLQSIVNSYSNPGIYSSATTYTFGNYVQSTASSGIYYVFINPTQNSSAVNTSSWQLATSSATAYIGSNSYAQGNIVQTGTGNHYVALTNVPANSTAPAQDIQNQYWLPLTNNVTGISAALKWNNMTGSPQTITACNALSTVKNYKLFYNTGIFVYTNPTPSSSVTADFNNDNNNNWLAVPTTGTGSIYSPFSYISTKNYTLGDVVLDQDGNYYIDIYRSGNVKATEPLADTSHTYWAKLTTNSSNYNSTSNIPNWQSGSTYSQGNVVGSNSSCDYVTSASTASHDNSTVAYSGIPSLSNTGQFNKVVSGLLPQTYYNLCLFDSDNNSPSTDSSISSISFTTDNFGAPTTPTHLTAALSNTTPANTVILNWGASAVSNKYGNGLSGYLVYVNGVAQPLVAAPATTLTVDGLNPSTNYSFYVQAVDNGSLNVSAPTKATSIATAANNGACSTTNPTAPTMNPVTYTNTSANLSWTSSSQSCGPGISGYSIFETETNNLTNAVTNHTYDVDANSLSYSDTLSVAPGNSYSYYVVANDLTTPTQNTSSPSNSVSFSIQLSVAAPTPPADISVTNFTQDEIDISWSPATPGDNPIAGYNIYVNSNSAPIATVGSNTYSFNATGLIPNTAYTFQVSAIDDAQPYNESPTISIVQSTLDIPTPSVIIDPGLSFSSILASQNIDITGTESGGTIADIKLYATDSNNIISLLDTQTSPSSGSTYSFIWNTIPLAFGDTNYPDGTYTLTALATDTSGVTSTSSPVTVYVDNGDVDGFKCVTLHDFSILASHYNQTVPRLTLGDIDANSIVQLHDFSILASNYGYKQPGSNCGGY